MYVFIVTPTTDFMLFVNTMIITWLCCCTCFFQKHLIIPLIFCFNLLFAALMLLLQTNSSKLPEITIESKTVYYFLLIITVVRHYIYFKVQANYS